MAGALGAVGGVLGDITGGVLDFRQTLINQRNDLLNPLVAQMQGQQATDAQDQTRLALGQTGQGMTSDEGLFTDLGPAYGLLADPRFQDNRSELTFAANLFGNPATQQLGSAILNNVVSGQSTIDSQANQAQQDLLLDLQTKAAANQRQREQDLLGLQQQTFTQEQALESDFAQAMAPTATAVQNFSGLRAAVESGNPLAVTTSIFNLAKLVDPNARTVTEGDVTTLSGSLPVVQQLNTALRQLWGGGLDENAAAALINIGQIYAGDVLRRNQPTYQNFIDRAQRNPLGLDTRNVVGRFGLESVLGQEGGIDEFLGPMSTFSNPGEPAPVPAGLTSGRAPQTGQRSVREIRTGSR